MRGVPDLVHEGISDLLSLLIRFVVPITTFYFLMTPTQLSIHVQLSLFLYLVLFFLTQPFGPCGCFLVASGNRVIINGNLLGVVVFFFRFPSALNIVSC